MPHIRITYNGPFDSAHFMRLVGWVRITMRKMDILPVSDYSVRAGVRPGVAILELNGDFADMSHFVVVEFAKIVDMNHKIVIVP